MEICKVPTLWLKANNETVLLKRHCLLLMLVVDFGDKRIGKICSLS